MSEMVQRIKRHFAFSDGEFIKYVNTAPYRYKTYYIRKRTGGYREISQPAKDLKSLQRFVLSQFILPKLELHDSATAYRQKCSITDNARPHLQNKFLLKMDFENFFPSIRATDFTRYALAHSLVDSADEAAMLGRIFFKDSDAELRLTIGSPGSPAISNALLTPFDQEVAAMCQASGISYTRYSDDLSFSTNTKGVLFGVPQKVEVILEHMNSPKLAINPAKTKFSSKKFNRHVTGITISNDGLMSLGRKTKRRVRSEVFNALRAEPKEIQRLRGYLSYAKQIEPEFVSKLWVKYHEQMQFIEQTAFTRRNGKPY